MKSNFKKTKNVGTLPAMIICGCYYNKKTKFILIKINKRKKDLAKRNSRQMRGYKVILTLLFCFNILILTITPSLFMNILSVIVRR